MEVRMSTSTGKFCYFSQEYFVKQSLKFFHNLYEWFQIQVRENLNRNKISISQQKMI